MTDFFDVYFFALESFTDFYFLSPFVTDFSAFYLPLLLLFDFYDMSSPPFFLDF